jgi:hypothetical protein
MSNNLPSAERKILIDAQSMAHPTSITSTTQTISQTPCYGVQASWDAASLRTGALSVEGSIDNVNFVTISEIAVSALANSYLLNVEHAGYTHVRVVYTSTAGSGGSLTVYFSSKYV